MVVPWHVSDRNAHAASYHPSVKYSEIGTAMARRLDGMPSLIIGEAPRIYPLHPNPRADYKMTGIRYVTELQLQNCRPGDIATFNNRYNASLQRSLRFHLANWTDHSMLARDAVDHAIFAHAAARFHRELRAHNITLARCPSASQLLPRGTSSCNAGVGAWAVRLQPTILRALSFSRLFPGVRRKYT